MSLIRLQRNVSPRLLQKARCFSTPVQQEEEYTATPQYPPILDLSYEGRKERRLETKYEAIRNVKTVEEKQLKVNMPRYFGFKTYPLLEEVIPYDSLPLTQHITRTHLIKNKDLPEYYENIQVENIENISKDIQEALLMEIDSIQRSYDLKSEDLTDVQREDFLASNIVRSINRVLNNNLANQYPHIINNEVDIDPRVESSWVVGGMKPGEDVKRCLKNHEFFKQFKDDPIDRTICYIGSPSLTIRAELPLPYVISPTEAENPSFEVPLFQYDPRVLGTVIQHRHAANIPGFWPGDSHTFGLISFLRIGHMTDRAKILTEENETKEALHRQAILSSYAWLNSQANFLGFTTYNDITYPLVTQTVLTDGKLFHFYIYQLNTILLHSKNTTENQKKNICWASNDLKLYDEIKDGKIVGFNEEVLKLLVKLYSNTPSERLGVNLRPYLSQDEKIVADYEDEEKRKWLEREYKFIMSNRPRFKELDEIYAWEKIYKVDNKSRFIEKRSRFFELFQQPWKRALNDRIPAYIPRACRPDLPRHKGRRAKEYWP